MNTRFNKNRLKFLFYDYQAINILLVNEVPSGGAAVQAHGWMQGLLSEGHEVNLITDIGRGGSIKEECKKIKLHSVFDAQKGIRWIRWIYYRSPYIYKKIKEINPDYLYQGIPSWHTFIFALICIQLNIKLIQRISNDFLLDDRFYKNHSRIHGFFLNLGLKLSYCILCQNDYQLNIIRKRFPNKKIFKISNPIFLNGYHLNEIDQPKEHIAWLGLFQYQKNLPLLYEIAKTLPGERFLIAGTESTNIDEETLIYMGKLKTLSNVEFIGFLERKSIIPFLSKAKFILNTSHYEGFSNTFLEAMSVGTPILSSVKVNPDEIISKNNLGVVYKNPEDLKEKLYALTPETIKSMSRNCLEFVSQYHDHRKLAKDLVKFLIN
ncbi:glycosyltransferase family 4 protein [Negadavirga shengliensis]|uniref:Glycosyltransferase family 4 protein n=1 Tax=Negadavirga shengliensis TaxID=1389218 RepID=A0ABV9T2S6_9BACT